jgi:hypothetical protein
MGLLWKRNAKQDTKQLSGSDYLTGFLINPSTLYGMCTPYGRKWRNDPVSWQKINTGRHSLSKFFSAE